MFIMADRHQELCDAILSAYARQTNISLQTAELRVYKR